MERSVQLICWLLLLGSAHGFFLSNLGIWQISGDTSSPVSVELYYESLCPGCRYFVETQLYPTFYKLRDTGILKVEMFPYGNAKEAQNPDGSWNFTCQHGDRECTGNLLEACIIKHSNMDSSAYLPVLACMEASDDPVRAAKGCLYALSSLPYLQIKKCAQGPEGNSLMHEIALKTESLSPPHQYVPWLIINGAFNATTQNLAMSDLTSLVCGLYEGEKPKQCPA